MVTRSILTSIKAVLKHEGLGSQIRRSIGIKKMRNFTPFVLLDHFSSPPNSGFPDHPHYGQSTVTYLLKGSIAHEDFTGSKGVLSPGDLQFMTAGRGIVHAEMPVDDGTGTDINGIQLWVDLPKDQKDIEPSYRDLRSEEIPVVKPNDKVTVKVISGESYGVKSVQDLAHVAVDYYDFEVLPGGSITQPFERDYNVFLYILKGSLSINGEKFNEFETIFFNRDGDSISARVPHPQQGITQFVLIGGQALDQQIVQLGPFVATSMEKIKQVSKDYQMGKNGFAKSVGFQSSIDANGGLKSKDIEEFLKDS